MDMTPKRAWFFDELRPGDTVWLGANPNEVRIECFLDTERSVGLGFSVINGGWSRTLYEGEEGCLYIIDERGNRHEPVYIVGVEGDR